MQIEDRYLIGELAALAGVSRETLRYYERRGLMKPARRTASGYRVYDRESAERLLFIKRAQAFGFSLRGDPRPVPNEAGEPAKLQPGDEDARRKARGARRAHP